MRALRDLAAEVLLGTERRPPGLAAAGGEVGELLAQVASSDAPMEVRVLRSAAILASCAAASYAPPLASRPLPAPSEPEALEPADDPTLVPVLRRILDHGPDVLRSEALSLMAGSRHCLPPRLLPRALQLGSQQPKLRAALLPVLGRRGEWLAQQQSGWSWAVGQQDPTPDPDLWDHGSLEQRRIYMERLRSLDPARARDLLAQGFEELEARERAALLHSLAFGLGITDEAFLDARLSDRSKEVRQAAASLLSRLPESGYAARMRDRLAACLGSQRKLLRQTLTLEAPTQFPADGKADALEEARAKGESLGERAWWLSQIAGKVPLSWWAAHTGLAPSELIRWVKGTDWAEAVERAWRDVQQRDRDPEWAAAFLEAPQLKLFAQDTHALIAQLPPKQRESHWLRLLGRTPADISIGELLAHIAATVDLVQTGLSVDFAAQVLREARKIVTTEAGKTDYALRRSLPDFACVIPTALLDGAGSNWPPDSDETRYLREPLAEMLTIIELRKALHRTINPGRLS